MDASARCKENSLHREKRKSNLEHPMNPTQASESLYCSQCGQPKLDHELARFGSVLVCAACKPAYAQQLREGTASAGTFHYGGFWIRLVAVLIDGIIVGLASAMVQAFLIPSLLRPNPSIAQASASVALIGLAYLLGTAIAASYEALFIYRMGATPGKLVMGLKVVRPGGGRISLGRSFGRYFAKLLSAAILSIGYIMAAFDQEKRALHDRIVDTRVIRARA
jgi:uncharacterized RDD family membrane protein YckC